jgi:hypothetical protein
VEVSGANDVQSLVKKFGNNAIFNGIPASIDPYGAVANSRNGGRNGLFPLPQAPTNSAPWEWTTFTNAPASCSKDDVAAKLYIDTIIRYYAPRACLALGLPCGFVNTKEIPGVEVGLSVMPVPAAEAVTFSADADIQSVLVFDVNGRMVRSYNEIKAPSFTMQRNNLANGIYFAQVRFEKGFVKRKLVFENN